MDECPVKCIRLKIHDITYLFSLDLNKNHIHLYRLRVHRSPSDSFSSNFYRFLRQVIHINGSMSGSGLLFMYTIISIIHRCGYTQKTTVRRIASITHTYTHIPIKR